MKRDEQSNTEGEEGGEDEADDGRKEDEGVGKGEEMVEATEGSPRHEWVLYGTAAAASAALAGITAGMYALMKK